jgi:DUF1009 family protein
MTVTMPRKTKDGEEWLQVVMNAEVKKRLKLESVRQSKPMGELLEEILDNFLPSESDRANNRGEK